MGMFILVLALFLTVVFGVVVYYTLCLVSILVQVSAWIFFAVLIGIGWFFIGGAVIFSWGIYELLLSVEDIPYPIFSLVAGTICSLIVQVTFVKEWLIPNIEKFKTFIETKIETKIK